MNSESPPHVLPMSIVHVVKSKGLRGQGSEEGSGVEFARRIRTKTKYVRREGYSSKGT